MTTFNDLPLSAVLKQRLAANKFVNPTPVQEQTLPHSLDGRDIVATAQTGTGKTLAFTIPMLEMLSVVPPQGVSALVLVPTRELAMQVREVFEALRPKKMTPAALVVGGLSEKTQIRSIRAGARVIVATPGRLEDYLRRKLVDLSKVDMLVLDEADRMLDMGFIPAIRRILSVLPSDRQTLCFSATLEKSVAGLVQQCTRDAVRIALGSVLKPAETVQLQAFEVPAMQKSNVLRKLLHDTLGKTLVFTRTKRGAERLAKELTRDGFAAGVIHGDRTQSQRNKALAAFEEGRHDVLVATDVAARGIHVGHVAHVVNFDLPSIPEDFIHRVGRTGRAGSTGLASTLVSGAESIELRRFEKVLKLRIQRMHSEINNEIPAGFRATSRKSGTLAPLPGEVFA